MFFKNQNRIVVLILVCLALVGCRNESAPASRTLLPIPVVDLNALEPAVRTHISTGQSDLDKAIKANLNDELLGEAFGEIGQLYHAYKLFAPAEACYLNAQTLHPKDYRWPHYLGYVHQNQNKIEQAIASFEKAFSLKSDYAPSLIGAARNYRKLNQLEKAEPLFKQALNFPLTKGAALAGMGDLALANRNYAIAITAFEQALQEMPAATELYYPLAQSYRGLGDTAKAETALAKRGTGDVKFGDELMAALADMTSGAHASISRGSQLMSAQKFAEANEEFKKAIETDPANVTARMNYASTFVLLQKYDEAKTQLNELLGVSPNYAKAHLSLGVLAAQLDKDAEAVTHFRAGLAVDKNLADANLFLGDALMRLKKYPEAQAAYQRQMELTPRNPSPHMRLVPALVRQRKFAEARNKMEDLVKGLPKHRDVMMVMVRLLAACPDNSIRDGKRAVELAEEKLAQETKPVYVQTRAMAYAEAGNFQKAIQEQRAALEMTQTAVDTGSKEIDLLKMLKEDLQLYERKQPCRRPWMDTDTIFFPAKPR